jgi:hypothetical protein
MRAALMAGNLLVYGQNEDPGAGERNSETKNALFEPISAENDHFAKTGSGQT